MAHGRRDRASSKTERYRDVGPTLYRRGRYWNADLRKWGGKRTTLRDPSHPSWPAKGRRTEDLEEATEWARIYLDRLPEDSANKEPGRPRKLPTLAEALEPYLRYRTRQCEPPTVEGDASAIRHLIRHCGGAHTSNVSTVALQSFFDTLIEEGYAISTLRTLRTSLGAFYKWLKTENAAAGIELPKEVEENVRIWADLEITQLRRAANMVDERRRGPKVARLLVEMGVATGARQMELFALQWQDFNAEQCTVRISRQLASATQTKHVKGKRPRTTLVLPEWWKFQRSSLGWVLPTSLGTMLSEGKQRDLLSSILDTARLNERGVAFHSFRHTYSRLLLERGCSMGQLQKSLGHKTERTTEETYGHLHEDTAARLGRDRIYGDARPTIKIVE